MANTLGMLGYFEAKGYANEAQPNLQLAPLAERIRQDGFNRWLTEPCGLQAINF